MQTTRQVAQAAGTLCGPAADYITGAVLLADGGCPLMADGQGTARACPADQVAGNRG